MREIKFRAWDREFLERYEVDKKGNIYGLYWGKKQKLKTFKDSDGYVKVMLTYNQKHYPRMVHRLVAETFLKIVPDKNIVNHKNGKRDDNRLENLEWCTSRENTIHGWKVNGRKPSEKNREWGRKLAKMINKKRWNYE